MSLLLFAGTLFVSAFVLFLVQPIVGKMILPKLGGTPQVWNTCMVFFQTALLAGYAYTHTVSTRLKLKMQLVVHAVLLFTALLVLFGTTMGPAGDTSVSGLVDEQKSLVASIKTGGANEYSSLATKQSDLAKKVSEVEEKVAGATSPMVKARELMYAAADALAKGDSEGKAADLADAARKKLSEAEDERIRTHPMSMETWRPKVLGANPIPDALTLLAWLVGLPFLVIATSAPLLQKWFVHTGHPAAKDPYFLYGASNLGSLMALLLYPVAVEPWLRLGDQAWLFAMGYCVLLVLVLCCVAMVFKLAKSEAMDKSPMSDPAPATEGTPAGPPPDETAVVPGAPPPAPAPAPVPEAVKQPSAAIKKGPPKQFAKHSPRPAGAPNVSLHRDTAEVTPLRRLRWVCLAAVPSSFMLGITSHITTDLSPVPLFWLVPLTLYLLSFILVYMRWPFNWANQAHNVVMIIQPIILAFMIFVEIMGWSSMPERIWWLVFINVLAFFAIALACHGELAKDRPGISHLTEYYLLMSVGGMLGGMFNGLVAPVFFWGLAEFPIAMFLACLVRPTIGDKDNPTWSQNVLSYFLDQPKPAMAHKAHKPGAVPHVAPEGPPSYDRLMDFVWPIVWLVHMFLGYSLLSRRNADAYYFVTYFVPLFWCCFYYARPVRLSLTVGAVLAVNAIIVASGDTSSVTDRSYFGIIRVKQRADVVEEIPVIGKLQVVFRQLIHGHIDHGMNFQPPSLGPKQKEQLAGKKYEYDFTRLATTYYHRYGPAGLVMEKYNWFAEPEGSQNMFVGDARLPAALTALAAADIGAGILPGTALAGMWSEPPYATIGLGTGTMASYARAYQHCHYYEIDNHIRRLSLPGEDEEGSFNYLRDAIKRKAEVQVLMGDARLRMALPYKSHHDKEAPETGGGPDNFYHMMVVDAFSSDAIPAHLITKQAIQMYFTKLTEEGILCVHTSNRFVNLPKVVAAVSSNLGYAYLRGRDDFNRGSVPITRDTLGHFTSEWVMVARKAEYLTDLTKIAARLPTTNNRGDYWSITPTANPRYLWTDDHYNLITVLRLFDKSGE